MTRSNTAAHNTIKWASSHKQCLKLVRSACCCAAVSVEWKHTQGERDTGVGTVLIITRTAMYLQISISWLPRIILNSDARKSVFGNTFYLTRGVVQDNSIASYVFGSSNKNQIEVRNPNRDSSPEICTNPNAHVLIQTYIIHFKQVKKGFKTIKNQ